MDQKPWRNPYMDRLGEIPGLLLGSTEWELSPEEKQLLKEKCTHFPSLLIELGSGSGGHLIELAAQNPTSLCVGFEIRFKRVVRTAEKALEKNIKNLMVLRTSAVYLPTLFLAGSVQGIYVNFPDPWDKRRWIKHRLLNPEFLMIIHRTLAAGGYLSYKTDHPEYFAATQQIIKESGAFEITQSTQDLHASPYASANIRTEFEKLFLSRGLPICFLQATRI